MTALSNLPSVDARQACVALGNATNWPAEEWAIAVQRLLDAGTPQQALGLEVLIRLTLAVKDAPSEVAGRMVAEFRKASASPAATSV